MIDGATGLGDAPLLDAPSDAAWLATRMGAAFARLAADGLRDPAAILTGAAEEVAAAFARERRRAPAERYEIPTAAVLLAVFGAGEVRIAELGDCRFYLCGPDGAMSDVGGTAQGRALEQANAGRVRGPGRSVRTPEVLALLREVRGRANTAAGYAVFAPDPAPARQARLHTLPWRPGACGLFVTDGFDALAADYGRYPAAELIAAARSGGLEPLVDELRRIERDEDPDCRRYPRFKMSDDATAVIVAAPSDQPADRPRL